MAWHLVLPVATLTLIYLAEYSLVMRASLVEELGQDYLKTARAKGLMDRMVRRRHAVPNALLPTITLVFLNIGFIVSGAITVETVYSWPGLGQLSFEAIRGPDIALLQAIFLLFSITVVVVQRHRRRRRRGRRPEDPHMTRRPRSPPAPRAGRGRSPGPGAGPRSAASPGAFLAAVRASPAWPSW